MHSGVEGWNVTALLLKSTTHHSIINCEILHHLQFHNWCNIPGMSTIYKQYTTLLVSQQLTAFQSETLLQNV